MSPRLRITDTVHLQVLPQKPRSRFLPVKRIAQRAQGIGELEQKRLALFARAQGREFRIVRHGCGGFYVRTDAVDPGFSP